VGGRLQRSALEGGASYHPLDRWTPCRSAGGGGAALAPRRTLRMWTATEMIVWGGVDPGVWSKRRRSLYPTTSTLPLPVSTPNAKPALPGVDRAVGAVCAGKPGPCARL